MTFLYIYRLASDTGLAPCIQDGLLSLAVCKGGQIRNGIPVNTGIRFWVGNKTNADWEKDDVYVIGTYKNDLLYLARITNVIPMTEYYRGQSKGRLDEIYKSDGVKLERNRKLQKENIHTEPERIKKDIAGQYVLLSDKYIYLGKDAKRVDILDAYGPKGQETKKYSGDLAKEIIKECKKCRDKKEHLPNDDTLQKKCGCS